MNMGHLLNKSYVIAVILQEQNLIIALVLQRGYMFVKGNVDLCKEVLWISVGQTDAKLQAVKV